LKEMPRKALSLFKFPVCCYACAGKKSRFVVPCAAFSARCSLALPVDLLPL
jgi:hypothetical protein